MKRKSIDVVLKKINSRVKNNKTYFNTYKDQNLESATIKWIEAFENTKIHHEEKITLTGFDR